MRRGPVYISRMRKALIQRSWLRRGIMAFGVFLLAYALLLRGLATPLPALPGSIETALANPHYLCLTEESGDGLPANGLAHCDECCLGLTRTGAPPPAVAPLIAAWPRFVWRPASLSAHNQLDGPPDEAWTRTHSQRGPPESRTPTSFS